MPLTLKLFDRRSVEIAAWPTDEPELSTTDVGTEDSVPVVEETGQFMFTLDGFDPDRDYTLKIGDLWVSDLLPLAGVSSQALGLALSPGMLCWIQSPYFESARGHTDVRLYSRESGEAPWQLIKERHVYVLPTKLGEERFDALVDDLQRLCGGLVLDLLGKSRRSFASAASKAGISFRSKEMELRAVTELWARMSVLIGWISNSPVTAVRRENARSSYWGDRPLPPSGIARLASLGFAPRDPRVKRPVHMWLRSLRESTATKEHRILLGFFLFLRKRVMECAEALERHIRLLEAERRYRDVAFRGQPSLYASADLPRIQRMEESGVVARQHYAMISKTARTPLFLELSPEFRKPAPHEFEQNSIYRAAKHLINEFLDTSVVWSGEQGKDATLKLTSRAYENWVFLKVVDAFRDLGLEFETWEQVIQDFASRRFTIDFERGLSFTASISGRKWIRITYEPWVHHDAEARRVGATVYRSGAEAVPWSPDVLIECLDTEDGSTRTLYAIVIDAKYSLNLRDDHWTNTQKYLEIRAVASDRQVVRQLWLAHPGASPGISCEDPAVSFSSSGISAPIDESVRGVIAAIPEPSQDTSSADFLDEHENDPFSQFASGTLDYFIRRVRAGKEADR